VLQFEALLADASLYDARSRYPRGHGAAGVRVEPDRRNLDKLLRALEFLIAHNATALTTNYMIRNGTFGYAGISS
jgi:hypothetical protein